MEKIRIKILIKKSKEENTNAKGVEKEKDILRRHVKNLKNR